MLLGKAILSNRDTRTKCLPGAGYVMVGGWVPEQTPSTVKGEADTGSLMG